MDLDTEAAQRVGTTLCNKWTLERLIGTGGMAAVYVATHKIGRREAIKILHSDVARDPELRARFEQEADAVNRFKHPGTVEVRDIDVAEDGSPFLVMELLEGQPLAALARQPGGVALADLLRWVDEMLDVLAAAHAQGIIHRDIKPDNLFIQSDGRLKVLDFGIARVRAGAPKLRTRVGATLGTAPYMPPEQIRGVEIDARADLFAVGATMFRLIAKRRIHEAANEAETLVKMASVPAPALASVAPDAPRDVCLVVDRALMFDREQRYPDALTMQGDVRALRDGRPPPHATARLADPAAAPPPPTRPATDVVIPSDAITPEALTRGGRAALGVEPTSLAGAAATPDGRTMAASPGALHAGLPPPPPLDAVTRPAILVAGAAPNGGAAPAAAPAPVPSGERTLRSVQGPEAAGHVVEAQGYVVGTTQMPAVHGPASAGGPRTQLSGAMGDPPRVPQTPPGTTGEALKPPAGAEASGVNAHPLAPGESIPVVAAPPRPKRRLTLPGTEISIWPLVIVGGVFAAIGVGITLWLMLRGPDPGDMSTYPMPSVTTAPTVRSEPILAPRTARPPGHSPGLAPQPTKHPK